jgi:formylglycine-generating enzyme required for sulfatase activity
MTKKRDMVFIRAGEFIMGDEEPRRVVLGGYWIDRYPVTVAQYRSFCEATGRQMPKEPYWGWHDDHPIVNVSWHDAIAYCDWAGARLPTEAEWEKAARGVDGRKYAWGNEWDAGKCNNWESAPQQTTPVGSYPQGASPYGVEDMTGNVWEWCSSLFKPYPYDANDGRENLSAEGRRVLRGGSMLNNQEYLFQCATRIGDLPDYWLLTRGFRCARDGRSIGGREETSVSIKRRGNHDSES